MTIRDLAISGLNGAVQSLLPPTAPGVEQGLVVAPVRLTPTGIGGFVGLNRQPVGEIIGKRVEARVLVTVRSNSLTNVDDSMTSLVTSLMNPSRETLQRSGILRLSLDEIGSSFAIGTEFAREVRFDVLYEFLQIPTASGDIIQEILVNPGLPDEGILAAPPAPGFAAAPNDPGPSAAPAAPAGVVAPGASVFFAVPVAVDFLDRFEVIDDPAATRNRPSRWEFNVVESRIEQLSNIWGGSSTVNANKPGTYLVLKTTELPEVQDFNLDVRLSSEDDDGIGLVFRWQDVENYYFFHMDSGRNYRLMGKKVAGAFQFLETSALDHQQGYTEGKVYQVTVNVVGSEFRVSLDGVLALQGQDSSISSPGRVGFMCRQNTQAYFYDLELTQLTA